jgi:3-hydroxyisobutyrate dehydrogenase-like beta-hydroxyacid dehydrogenase
MRDGFAGGHILADCSTTNPEFIRTLANQLARRHAQGPHSLISGGVKRTAEGELSFFTTGAGDLRGIRSRRQCQVLVDAAIGRVSAR